MPELKREFKQGIQNRDFDDRVLPAGQTRQVVNGRIARSEGSDVGAIENVRGNLALSDFVDDLAVVIGSVRQQSENRIFYFVTGSREDGIYEYSENTGRVRIIVRSTIQSGVLKFSVDNLITGIDVIGQEEETLLFWTDGENPPRRVNIERMVLRHQGRLDGVIVDAMGNIELTGFTEEEISVVKRPPNTPPLIDIVEVDDLNPDNDDERETLREENLKDKFVRFATRFKYRDDEYSVLSPFSEVPFSTGQFSFDRTTGRLTCMENLVRELEISFDTGPRDVIEVDLIYKSDSQPEFYIVESYVKADEGWGDNILLSTLNQDISGNPIEQPVTFSSNKLYRILPDRDANATFHNVPLKAKAQAIVSNRLVYGNYTDRYNIEDILSEYAVIGGVREVIQETPVPITIDLEVELANNSLNTSVTDEDPDAIGRFGEKNLKSDRDYELGIVYFDSVGRSTPVITSPNNSIHIPVHRANRRNRMQVTINSKAPHWATHYRFFIKNNRSTHFNIVPLDSTVQPDNNEWKWYRISSNDSNKIKEGDYLSLKIAENSFIYAGENQSLDKQILRIEEIGLRERNFLELEVPRVGGIINDTTGEVYDEGAVITLQEPGIWMKVRNLSVLGRDVLATADSHISRARSNNARDLNNKPIIGPIADYKDVTYYYRGSIINNDEVDSTSVTFGATYTPGTGLNSGAPAALTNPLNFPDGFTYGPILADATHAPGPMRVELTIEPDSKYSVAYYLSPNSAEPAVRRGTVTPTGGLDLPATGTTIQLFNGVTVVFNEVPTDFNVGDRFVSTWRLSNNFMWRCYAKSGRRKENRYRGPNNTSRRAFNARRTHIMLGMGQIEDGINGGSLIQFGVDDGLNNVGRDNLAGTPIALQFNKNEYYTDDVFYDTLEEWIFESGLWSGGSGDNFNGTGRNGERFGIHQMGFWRGLPTVPGEVFSFDDALRIIGGPAAGSGVGAGFVIAGLTSPTVGIIAGLSAAGLLPIVIGVGAIGILISVLAKNKETSSDFRLASDVGTKLLNADGAAVAPLYMFIQSGTFNDSSNNKKADHRMSSEFSFVQGTGASESDLSTVPTVFETLPPETALDNIVFYEIGNTYKCENGVHYGDDPQNHQLVNTVPPTEAGTETTEVTRPITVVLDYTNTVAFSNGVESSVIRDEFGESALAQGAKSSITLEDFEQENNIATLIYSGAFNSSTNVNDLNVFSSADVGNRTILKELDTNFGTIQLLYAENRDLYVFQEDKVSRVQINRNTLVNADGSANVTASSLFLNETLPITGEYGISLNPESFAVYGPSKYWADRSRGVILLLEGTNLREISKQGMSDFFRDNLAQYPLSIGSYDDYHNEYLVTMRDAFTPPSGNLPNIPLIISRQGFLSRNDACRFAESRIQYKNVYEFYTVDEPLGFQLGDIIYNDVDRVSVFNGDDDWFIWFDSRRDVPVTTQSLLFGNQFRLAFDTTDDRFTVNGVGLTEELIAQQAINLQSITNPGTIYTATVIQVDTTSVNIVFGTDTVFETGDDLVGAQFDLEVDIKYVINIDSFGVTRRKLNCIGIQAFNHDAFRASLTGYQSPQEACGNGIVGRILYHNGDDATPDTGDFIYDTPYGSDEYVEIYQNYLVTFPYNTFDRVVFNNAVYEASQDAAAGITPTNDAFWTLTDLPADYKKGRTRRSGWYQMFDGSDFEDYVIFIVRGIVVQKIRCDSIRANRTRVLVGDRVVPLVDSVFPGRAEYSARVCRELPTEERYHDGESTLPIIGDTMFDDDFTTDTLTEGSYSLTGGFYAEVNEDGIVSAIFQCIIRECIRDLINTYGVNDGLFTDQINNTGNFTFVGVIDEEIYGTTERQIAVNATVRWVARGSERYPANPSDFYEMTFPGDGSLEPGTEFTLTNPEFLTASAGETDLQYTVLELCYDRNLVPQNITFRYFQPDVLTISERVVISGTGSEVTFVFGTEQAVIDVFNRIASPLSPISTGAGTGIGGTVESFVDVSQDGVTAVRFADGTSLTLVSTVGDVVNNAIRITGDIADFSGFETSAIVDTLFQTTAVQPADSYPSSDASIALARIFDLTGNTGTGTVEVTEEIFFDRTAMNRIYFIDEELTPLDGTNGGGTPLWWAFGEEDNTAATEACRIDSTGLVLECRDRNHPFEFNLAYHATNEISACVETSRTIFLTDAGDASPVTRDFEDVTSLRTITGAIPPSGFYTHLEQEGTIPTDDDQNIVRFWNSASETFEARWPLNTDTTTDNCPVSLPVVNIRFSTNIQTAVCGSGTFGDVYLSDSTATFAAKSGVIVWRGEFGTNASPAGYFGPDGNGATWFWDGTDTISQENTACIMTCTDVDATNTGQTGDCTYPTYCSNAAASNFNQLQDGTATSAAQRAKFNSSASAPVCDLGPVTSGCTDSTAFNFDAAATSDDGSCMFCADLTGQEQGGSRVCSGTTLVANRFTGAGTGDNCVIEQFTVETDSSQCQFSCPASGTADGASFCGTGVNAGNLVQNQFTGITPTGATQNSDCPTSVVVITAGAPACGTSGCTDSGADNFDSGATTDDGSCFATLFTGATGSSGPLACAAGGSTTIYSTVGGAVAFTDTALTARFNTFISDSTNFRSYSNGVLGVTGACPPPTSFSTLVADAGANAVSVNQGFTVSFTWTGVDLPSSIFYLATGTGVVESPGGQFSNTYRSIASSATSGSGTSITIAFVMRDSDGIGDGTVRLSTEANGGGITISTNFTKPINNF